MPCTSQGCTCRCVTERDAVTGKALKGCAVGSHCGICTNGCHSGHPRPRQGPATTAGRSGVRRGGFRKGENATVLRRRSKKGKT